MADQRKSWYSKAKAVFQASKSRASDMPIPKQSSQLSSSQVPTCAPSSLSPEPARDQIQEIGPHQSQTKGNTDSEQRSLYYKKKNFCPTCSTFLSKLAAILSQPEDQIRATDYE